MPIKLNIIHIFNWNFNSLRRHKKTVSEHLTRLMICNNFEIILKISRVATRSN